MTNYYPKTVVSKRAITNALQAMKSEYDYVTYHIFFGFDIEHEVMEIENPKEYVDEAVVELDATNNFIQFGEEKFSYCKYFCQIFKTLYEQYGYRGLFAQNLRYYVKTAKIDGNIIASIQEQPEKVFSVLQQWYNPYL